MDGSTTLSPTPAPAAEDPAEFDRRPGSPRPGSPARIHVADATARLSSASIAGMEQQINHAAGLLRLAGEGRIRIAGDSEVAAAHLKHLGVPGSTDVITFDLADPGSPRVLDADILVCLDEAERQAQARGTPIENELLLYMIHGLLHCLGYDDHDERAWAAMHAREDEILTALGIGPVFAAPRKGEKS